MNESFVINHVIFKKLVFVSSLCSWWNEHFLFGDPGEDDGGARAIKNPLGSYMTYSE